MKRFAAETTSLLSLYPQGPQAGDQHYLVVTDTYAGQKSASVLTAFLEQFRLGHPQLIDPPGLQTADPDRFHDAATELIKRVYRQVVPLRNTYQIVFNLTGGFKALNQVMTLTGLFVADQVVNQFEQTDRLLTIPHIPIQLQQGTVEHVKQNLAAFRQMHVLTTVPPAVVTAVDSIYLLPCEEQFGLSAFGELVWQELSPEIYRSGLLPSPHPKIEYGPDFQDSVEKLYGKSADLTESLNHRIDDLMRYHVENKTLDRLDRKKRKQPYKNATHEFDVTNQGQAQRVFFVERDGRDVLLFLERGTH
ncbi:MAG: hypothetical protein ACOCX1_05500 [Fimbriimonadaceae bacterium]